MKSLERLGKFEITEQLGQGSFGVVYRGRDPHLSRDVAIKLCTLADDSLRRRFFREAEISGRLDHPNIVTVHDFSIENGTPYLVQEFLAGEDLREVIKRREPWSVAQRLEVLVQVADGLAYAHDQGVIHRDIKPANVRVLLDGRVKIMDFGIAKLAHEDSQLTQKGVTMGTASYLPPEQVRGTDIDIRSDLFSFGVLAYELLTFERPFRGKTISALVYQILYKVPAALSNVWPQCPEELSQLVASCLEKDPTDRPEDAHRVAAALRSVHQRVLRGEWPALQAQTAPVGIGDNRHDSSLSGSDLLSQSVIGRAAAEAQRHAPSDEATITSPNISSAQSNEATQPVPVMYPNPLPTPPVPSAQAATVIMATQPMKAMTPTMGDDLELPDLGAGSAVVPGDEGELATSALEISQLVAEGNLEAAMEQLEETIHRQRDDSGALIQGDVGEEVPAPAIASNRRIDPELPTVRMDRPTAPPPPVPSVPDGAPPKHTGDAEITQPTGPGLRTQRSHSRGGLPKAALAVGGIFLALLLIALAFLFSGREEPEVEVAPVAVAPPPPVVVPDQMGGLRIVATPWAKILEITDVDGFVHELPPDAATPLYIELPEGLYRVTLAFADGVDTSVETSVETSLETEGESAAQDGVDLAGEEQAIAGQRVCEVQVALGEVAECLQIVGEPSAIELFKDNGWWQ